MTSVQLERIYKQFGETPALRQVDLRINEGELFFLLGPSGCGKTTLLRIIAGLHEPTGGKIFFGQRDVTALPTEARNAVMCFQSYALWPHMDVWHNVAFGLEVRKRDASQRKQRVEQMLKLVRMDGMEERKPNTLSGGQQQRIALARALAVEPDCLLLDEPLSNLDAKLRTEMRGEIRRICKTAGLTTIYVTHDQKEALSIADRIAVMDQGRVVQVGTPAELYHTPRTSFVADFIGEANLIEGTIVSCDGDSCVVRTAAGEMRVRRGADTPKREGSAVVLCIRPEQMRLIDPASPRAAGMHRVEGRTVSTIFLGEASEHEIDVNGQYLSVFATPPRFDSPPRLAAEFALADVIVLSE